MIIDDNLNAVNELVLSQEEHQQTHRSQREIARQTGVSQLSGGTQFKIFQKTSGDGIN